ncbi:hypothetical protein BDK51DRAFT_35339 [Blyttiomyces helicus]|uniref:Uncharacterized protein n=1 Tax=Blyttiomyces helicus TaxID=388810 RepID=A0A4P9WKH5_9FUNG|nr:hypothetical protein BDK51DRAFT_35339 [Blyttiomyces helicus]|eukprot:RKO92625.1 hypothetical protein BDK51DRAFT_35339 [Blyttiomyces helicus]
MPKVKDTVHDTFETYEAPKMALAVLRKPRTVSGYLGEIAKQMRVRNHSTEKMECSLLLLVILGDLGHGEDVASILENDVVDGGEDDVAEGYGGDVAEGPAADIAVGPPGDIVEDPVENFLEEGEEEGLEGGGDEVGDEAQDAESSDDRGAALALSYGFDLVAMVRGVRRLQCLVLSGHLSTEPRHARTELWFCNLLIRSVGAPLVILHLGKFDWQLADTPLPHLTAAALPDLEFVALSRTRCDFLVASLTWIRSPRLLRARGSNLLILDLSYCTTFIDNSLVTFIRRSIPRLEFVNLRGFLDRNRQDPLTVEDLGFVGDLKQGYPNLRLVELGLHNYARINITEHVWGFLEQLGVSIHVAVNYAERAGWALLWRVRGGGYWNYNS